MQEVMAPYVYLKWFVKIQVIRRAKLVAGIVVTLFLLMAEYNVEALFRFSDAKFL